MIITISGLPGSGTTSVSKRLQELTGFELVSAGKIFRKMASEKKMSLEDFGKLADSDLKIDRELDEEMYNIALTHSKKNQNLILEGRLVAYVVKNFNPVDVLTIHIQATNFIRFLRISKRDKIDIKTATKQTRIRESNEKKRHLENYGENIESQNYALVIDSTRFDAEKIADIIFAALPDQVINECLII